MKRIPFMLASAALLLCSLAAGAAGAADAPALPEGVREIKTAELKALFDAREKFILFNSLSALEFTQSKIPGAVNLPYGQLRDGAAKFPADKSAKLIFYCLGPG